MTNKIIINGKFIGKNYPVFIIAEAGVNHNGCLSLALKLIDAAAGAGADAVKFQTFKAEQVVTAAGEMADYQKRNIGKTTSQLAMLKKLELPEKYYPTLIKRAKDRKIIFLSTPHGGFESVDFLQKLKIPAFKFGSGDLTNLPLLKYAAKFKKPLIISTGMANLKEVQEAIKAINQAGNNLVIVLHCTSNYPTPLNQANLLAIKTLAKEFGLTVGYSDHTEGIKVSLTAVALGARMIEKHFTLDKTLPGPDHIASLAPAELKEMVERVRIIESRLNSGENAETIIKELQAGEALGSGIKKPFLSELKTAKIARKSLVARVNIPQGAKITRKMLEIKRPGTGIEPRNIEKVIGKTARINLTRDALLTFKNLK